MIWRSAMVVALAAVLTGCAMLAKEPVPIGERAAAFARPPLGERTPGDSAIGQEIAARARQHVGAPYRWGGSSPSGFDCSGLVRYVYAQVGVSLPHNAAKQYRLGAPVAREELEPGDLVFFDRLRHNGIYVGDGLFVHARQTGRGVNIGSLDDGWYASHWVGARRLDLSADAGWDQLR